MSGPIRVGVVGGGLVSQVVHLPVLTRLHRHYTLRALAEPSPALRAGLGRRFGIDALHEDWREMIHSGQLDAVVVAAPNALHAPIVLAALSAGLHCFVEKPLCIDPADAVRIAAAADRADRVVQVGYMKRFDRVAESAVAALRDAAASPLVVDVMTYDPGLSRFFGPDELRPAPGDVPAGARDELREAEQAQCHAAVGAAADRDADRRMLVDVFLGALVHDVNLLAWIADARGLGPLRGTDARILPDARGAQVSGLMGDAPWTASWVSTPAIDDFAETVRVLTPDAAHELCFQAPYGAVKRRGTRHTVRAGGRSTTTEERDDSFDRELAAFAAAITGHGARRNVVEEAARDVTLLCELFATAGGRSAS
ncbi:Gfo/Idh/MocA family protein [Dactylosporangium sucinum]|uniref:Gfo/Idh/MocA-like oxidoreductase N-terminal domain-containing protein n=1 Tax=Dactylosporangium sucinum TaxID=1424081 RepID=A0A917TT59_9ACTN|nr:Gfo/Idh/MocA family oxidoreductase [Dactylosporangium sucinum]GGM36316.1 hypothetical protein GCM10007977_042110 [Dactylosporangium sucinum]